MRLGDPGRYKYYYDELDPLSGDQVTSMLRGLRLFINTQENAARYREPLAKCVKRIVEIYQIAAAQSGVSSVRPNYSSDSSLS